jgi:photosystem II stability/assembly factor-like uncharacterized protein
MINLFFVDNQYGFAQGASQLQVTRDGGNTWSPHWLPTQNSSNNFMNVFFSSRSTGYVSQAGVGVYKTTDTGNTWKDAFHTNGVSDYHPYFSNGNNGYVFAGDGSFSKTTDGSSTWQQLSQTAAAIFTNKTAYNSLQFIDSLTGYYACTSLVLKTTDGGITWKTVFPTGGNVSVVKFFTANTGYYKADSTIYKTTDGGQSWTTNCKLAGDFLTGMNFVDSTHGWACTGKGYILRTGQ